MSTPKAPPRPKVNLKILFGGLLLLTPILWVFVRGFSFNPNVIDSPLIEQPAPTFELPRLSDGELVAIDQLRGKPVVLNFWATWCASCPYEHPYLVSISQRFGSKVQFVGIAYYDKNEAISSWLRRNGGDVYPTLVDVGGKAAIAYGVYGVPETYVIDKDGTVKFKHTGPIDPRQLKRQIESLL